MHAIHTLNTSQMTNHDFQRYNLSSRSLEHTTHDIRHSYDNGVKHLFCTVYIECVCVVFVFIVVQLLSQYTINVFSFVLWFKWTGMVCKCRRSCSLYWRTHAHAFLPPFFSVSPNSKSKTASVWPLNRTHHTIRSMQSVNDYYNNECYYYMNGFVPRKEPSDKTSEQKEKPNALTQTLNADRSHCLPSPIC